MHPLIAICMEQAEANAPKAAAGGATSNGIAAKVSREAAPAPAPGSSGKQAYNEVLADHSPCAWGIVFLELWQH